MQHLLKVWLNSPSIGQQPSNLDRESFSESFCKFVSVSVSHTMYGDFFLPDNTPSFFCKSTSRSFSKLRDSQIEILNEHLSEYLSVNISASISMSNWRNRLAQYSMQEQSPMSMFRIRIERALVRSSGMISGETFTEHSRQTFSIILERTQYARIVQHSDLQWSDWVDWSESIEASRLKRVDWRHSIWCDSVWGDFDLRRFVLKSGGDCQEYLTSSLAEPLHNSMNTSDQSPTTCLSVKSSDVAHMCYKHSVLAKFAITIRTSDSGRIPQGVHGVIKTFFYW